VLHLGYVGGIGVGGQGVWRTRSCERSHWATSQLQLAGLLVDFAEMVVDAGVGAGAVDGLAQVLFRQGILAHLEVDPAERIEEGAVLRVESTAFLIMASELREIDAAIGEHVAEIVEDGRVLRVDDERLAVLGFGLVVLLLAVSDACRERGRR
jgi:hypothetical protein